MIVTAKMKCTNSANIFCYICGKFCITSQRKPITENTKKCYSLYFGRGIENQNESWVPNISCKTCEVNLSLWWTGKRDQMSFAVPMTWRKPRNHRTDCYFCMKIVKGFSPVKHCEDFPVPITPNATVQIQEKKEVFDKEERPSKEEKSILKDPDYVPESSEEPHFNQAELSDLIRDLGLTK